MTAKDERRRNKVDATGRHVAKNLKRLRRARNMSTTDLSRELEERNRPIAPTGITRIEAGQRAVDVDDLLTLSDALQVPPSALLFPFEDDPDVAVEITSVGTVPAWKAWKWADGDEPIKHPFDEDDFVDFQMNGRPKFKRAYVRLSEMTPEERRATRARLDQVYNAAQYPDPEERAAKKREAFKAAGVAEEDD